MSADNKIKKSPINSENPLELYLKCKDFMVSDEVFSLLKDTTTEILITNPQPKKEHLASYYESENYISHTDSEKSFIDRLYQKVKKKAIVKKVKISTQFEIQNSTKNILDIGCGTGDFLVACKNKEWNITGVEPNKKARVIAKYKLGFLTSKTTNFENNNSTIFTSINELENTFDVITMWHVLEHVPDLENYIAQLKKLLKPKGTLIIAVPNYKSFDATYYKEFWAAYDVPRHLWHFSQKAITLFFKKINMSVKKTIPMKYDSFYVSLLSEKNKTGKSNMIKAFFVGFWSNIKALRTKEYSSLIYVLKNNEN